MKPASVGELACQRDSYLTVLITRVVSCESAGAHFVVIFEDTIFFPEGGGQPSDSGTIIFGERSFSVLGVRRNGLAAEHLLAEALPVAAEVRLELDWVRRFDHMQQHTGQHLVSAMCDRGLLQTLSWHMTKREESICYVEIPRELTPNEVSELQQRVNEAIQRAVPISVDVVRDFDQTDTSKVPLNYDFKKLGSLRSINIKGIDENLCCGTHLANTAQLGACTILFQAPGKGQNSRLHYLIGDRLAEYLQKTDTILRQVCRRLSCSPNDVLARAEKLVTDRRQQAQALKDAFITLGQRDVIPLNAMLGQRSRVALISTNGDTSYTSAIVKNAVVPASATLVLINIAGGAGSVHILGHAAEAMGKHAVTMLKNLKGGGSGQRWQGKIADADLNELEKFVDWFENAEMLPVSQ